MYKSIIALFLLFLFPSVWAADPINPSSSPKTYHELKPIENNLDQLFIQNEYLLVAGNDLADYYISPITFTLRQSLGQTDRIEVVQKIDDKKMKQSQFFKASLKIEDCLNKKGNLLIQSTQGKTISSPFVIGDPTISSREANAICLLYDIFLNMKKYELIPQHAVNVLDYQRRTK